MSLSRKFTAFGAKLTYEDLPPEVVDRAKQGCDIAGPEFGLGGA
jgi:hypothetical protein